MSQIRNVWSTVSLSKIKQRFYRQKSDEDSNRGQWGNKIEFFLATLGYSVGIGNLTRFPYMCMKNGGGAFLIPFLVALFAGGIPLFYIELALGQFSGLSALTVWSFCPIFRGVGYACVILSGLVSIYYNMLLTWCIFYLVKSLNTDIPWRDCNNEWNTAKCYDPFSNVQCSNGTETCNTEPPKDFVLPSEDFWNNVVLGANHQGLENVGGLRWQLVLCLFTAWLMVFFCLMKGVKSSGKVVYVTATLPYILLTVLIVRGVTLEGAADGLEYYLKPNFTTLTDHKVWVEASLQMFYSLGPAWGVLITMASYNSFRNNRLSIDGTVIPIADVATALYGGFAIFSVIGFMAKKTNMPISNFAKSGIGLAFVVYPQAIAEMPVSPLWSVLFFTMLITLAIDSQFGFFDTLVSGLFDLYPKLRSHKPLVTGGVAALFFLLGLPFCTEGGIYVYTLIDWYTAAITVTTVGFLEIIIIAYIYGLKRFSGDIKLMLGSEPNLFWKLSWLIVTPLFMGMVLFLGLWTLRDPNYGDYQYPNWAVALGWIISFLSFLPIPGFAIYAIATSPHKSLTKKVSSVFLPTDEWLPAEEDLANTYRTSNFKSGRCPFCAVSNPSKSSKCGSLFRCWVKHSTCKLCGVKPKPGSSHDDQDQPAASSMLDKDESQEYMSTASSQGYVLSRGHRENSGLLSSFQTDSNVQQIKTPQQIVNDFFDEKTTAL